MIANDLVDCGAVKFGDFTLTSGKKSRYYVDIKQASTDPGMLAKIAELMGENMNGEELIAGVELGAVPLAAALALETGKPYLIIRKPGRGHGTAKRLEGKFSPGQRVVLVEDVITTAGSSIEGIKVLRDAGLEVSRVIVVVDREEGGEEALKKHDIELISLATASQLLEIEGGE